MLDSVDNVVNFSVEKSVLGSVWFRVGSSVGSSVGNCVGWPWSAGRLVVQTVYNSVLLLRSET